MTPQEKSKELVEKYALLGISFPYIDTKVKTEIEAL